MSSGVEFDEDRIGYGAKPGVSRPGFSASSAGPSSASGEPKMVRWLVGKGLAKSAKSANVVLLAVVIANIIIAYLLVHFLL